MLIINQRLFSQIVLTLFFTLGASITWAATPVEAHGDLAVKGNKIVDKSGLPVSFSGPSFFWSSTGMLEEKYYTPGMVTYYKNDWRATIVRAAMGIEGPGGYLQEPKANKDRIFTVVDAAIKEDLYVIVDWHSHHAEEHPKEAIAFFQEVAQKYGKLPNIIYEIYNEPLRGAEWGTAIKPYAEKVIPAIRAIDPDNLIIVGTPVWSQDVDVAAADPIKDVKNLAYTLHFYAGTHKQYLRDKAKIALDKGLALMVTEWGTVNANGDGGVNKEETLKWFAFMKEHQLTNCNWAVSDKAETASHFNANAPTNGELADKHLTNSGLFVKQLVKTWDDPVAIKSK